jgi:hypothetical protein
MKQLLQTLYLVIPQPFSLALSRLFKYSFGSKSLVADVYSIKTDIAFVNTLEDNIRKQGAMDKLISDSARVESSSRIKSK